MSKAQQVAAAVLALVGAAVIAANGIGIVHWTDAQTGVVLVASESASALILAVIAHTTTLSPKGQPVAIGASVTAFAAAMCAVASGFQWWNLTDAQNGLVVGVVTAAVAVFAAIFAHQSVEPIKGNTPG